MWNIIDKPASNKQIYFWNMVGSLTNSLTSFVLLMIVSRLLNNSEADIFSISFSVSQMLYTIGSFQVRVFQSTDVKEQFTYHEYRTFRFLSCAVMILSCIGYILFHGYTDEKAVVFLILTIYRMLDAYADVIEGLYQQKERLDLSGRFLSYRSGSAMVIFAVVLSITNNLIAGCVSMCITSLIITVLFSARHTYQFVRNSEKKDSLNQLVKKLWDIFIRCLPIFLNGFLLNYVFNIPKNAIDVGITSGMLKSGSQTIYNILFMPAFVVNLMFIFFRPQITRMAVYYQKGESKKMLLTAFKIGLFLTAATLSVCVLGVTVGIPILGFLYGRNLNNYRLEFAIILLGGGLSTLSALADNLLTVVRYQYFNLIGYVFSLGIAVTIVKELVVKLQVLGASLTFLISMIVLTVSLYMILIILLRRKNKLH